eukprot:5185788-Prymnesium_polylepis.1
MLSPKAVSGPTVKPNESIPAWPMAYGLWCAVRRYSDATRSCGASGTSPLVALFGDAPPRVPERACAWALAARRSRIHVQSVSHRTPLRFLAGEDYVRRATDERSF